ncbi:MAG: RNA pseudouridine synthase [Epulopiscium sp. Nele67-Bin005]|nr:MAG: RNA pseudouridine synthase [Epulopiscium sp. Nele67-Bin005]
MNETISFVIEENESGRIDKILAKNYPDFTRSFIQKQIEKGLLTINNKQQSGSYKVKTGDTIELNLPPLEEVDILPENIPLNIVYEDNDLIIINKPQGMVVHPASGHYSGTLVNALMHHCKDSLSGINGEIRPGIVHRIDKDTSGLLMVAKNDKAHLSLSEQLKDHSITRKYHAIVYGKLKDDEGIIDKPIARSPKDRKKMAIVQGGREAKTSYKVIERFKDATYVELKLYTGRTHQIRVHMTSIGYPLIGDPLYGRTKHIFGLDQQMLHAKVLGFDHPITNEKLHFESELPQKFSTTIDRLRKIT